MVHIVGITGSSVQTPLFDDELIDGNKRKISTAKEEQFNEREYEHGKRPRISKKEHQSSELPPVVIQDPNDLASVRRARNTEAARRSRAKKNDRLEALEALVAKLQKENIMLYAENKLLKQMAGSTTQ